MFIKNILNEACYKFGILSNLGKILFNLKIILKNNA